MQKYETEQQRLDARRETNRRYYAKTREIRCQKQKQYYETNKEEINLKNKKRKARRAEN